MLSTIYNPHCAMCDRQSTIHIVQCGMDNLQSTLCYGQSTIHIVLSTIHNPHCAKCDQHSTIRIVRGAIDNPPSMMCQQAQSWAPNYVNACPNQPEPSKVFRADHCKCAESRGVLTSLKEFTKYSKGMCIRTSRIPYCIMLLSSMLACTENPNWIKKLPTKDSCSRLPR